MNGYIDKAGLAVAAPLAGFIDGQVLPGLKIEPNAFWAGVAEIFVRFSPENAVLLAKRDNLQAQLDAWHEERAGQPIDMALYKAFLKEIGYLVEEPAPFTVETAGVAVT